MHQCASCGSPTCEHDRQARFRLPDPVLDLKRQERTWGTWMTHRDANSAVMMRVPKVGCFVRALLPVQLSDGYSATYGVWVGVRAEDMRHAFDVWWEPSYVDLVMDGFLANAIEPWGLQGAAVRLAVVDTDATPYVVASDDPVLRTVLAQEWPADDILPTLP